MDKNVLSYNQGRLLYASGGDHLKVSVFRFKPDGFTHETDIEAAGECFMSTQRPWTVLAAQQCVELCTRDRLFFLLAHRACTEAGVPEHIGLFRLRWHNGGIFSHAEGRPDTGKHALQIISLLDFPFANADPSRTSFSVIYGPAVICVSTNTIIFYHHEGDSYAKSEFQLNEGKHVLSNAYTDFENVSSTTVLDVKSDHGWVVALVLQKLSIVFDGKLSSTIAMVVFALDKSEDSHEYRKKSLDSRQFLPQDYAAKISSFSLHTCKRRRQTEAEEVQQQTQLQYDNTCVIGLNDGYVLVFENGFIKLCVSLEINCESFVPSVAVEQVQLFEAAGVLVCHTSSKECCVISFQTSKVIYAWQNVAELIIGDFLQHGGQQLLLLFDGWSPQTPHVDFLLTDFQGLLMYRRSDQESLSLPYKTSTEDSLSSSSVQHVYSALQAQNQNLVSSVVEEEHRLQAKHAFLVETLRQLQNLSHGRSTSIQQPEVPLAPLLGTPLNTIPTAFPNQDHGAPVDAIKVLSTWHRMVGSSWVVGVQIRNTSQRELSNCSLVLSTPSCDSIQNFLSTTSKMWRCCQLPVSTSVILENEESTCSNRKQQRIFPLLHAATNTLCNPLVYVVSGTVNSTVDHPQQRVNHQLNIQQTDVVMPEDTVTVTCCFPTPACGHRPQIEFFIHLKAAYQMVLKIQETSDQDNVSSTWDKGDAVPSTSKVTEKTAAETEKSSSGCSLDENRPKFVFCGRVVLKAGEVLQQNSTDLWGTLETVGTSDAQLEIAALAICAVQECWSLNVSFVLNEASVLQACLHRAGLVYLPRLGCYVCSQSSPTCLRFVRVAVVDGLMLSRCAKVLVYARDADQLLLLLRHLYTHLPEDATFTVASEDRVNTNVRNLTTALASELRTVRQQSRAVLHSHRGTLVHAGTSTVNPSVHTATSTVNSAKQQKGCSEATSWPQSHFLNSEVQEFAERQRRFSQSDGEAVLEMEREHFFSVAMCCSLETDQIVAQL